MTLIKHLLGSSCFQSESASASASSSSTTSTSTTPTDECFQGALSESAQFSITGTRNVGLLSYLSATLSESDLNAALDMVQRVVRGNTCSASYILFVEFVAIQAIQGLVAVRTTVPFASTFPDLESTVVEIINEICSGCDCLPRKLVLLDIASIMAGFVLIPSITDQGYIDRVRGLIRSPILKMCITQRTTTSGGSNCKKKQQS